MRCLHCDRRLPLWKRLANQKYCSEDHREKYINAHHRYAFEQLAEKDPQGRGNGEDGGFEARFPAEEADALAEAQPGDSDELVALTAPDEEGKQGQTQDRGVMALFLATVEADRHYYQEILDKTPVAIAVLNEDLSVHYANTAFRSLSEMEQSGKTNPNLRDRSIHRELPPIVETVLATCAPQENIILQTVRETGSRSYRISVRPLAGQDEEKQAALLVVEDVSEVLEQGETEANDVEEAEVPSAETPSPSLHS